MSAPVSANRSAVLAPWLEPVFAKLVAAAAGERLPHALLIHGPGGWGEPLLADAFALHLIERSGDTPAAAVAHPDLRWVVPEGAGEQIKIDSVRAIADFMVQTPQIAPCKVAALVGAEAMNPHAANALLKTLEEPPRDSYLILVSDALGEMLPTLRSRCRLIAIRPGPAAATLAWVREQRPAADGERIAALAFEYGGAPYRVVAALDRDEQPIVSMLGAVVARRQDPLQLADTWARGSTIDVLERWMRYVPRILGARPRPDLLGDVLADVSARRLLAFWDQLTEARGLLRGTTNPNTRLMLETLLMDWRDLAHPV